MYGPLCAAPLEIFNAEPIPRRYCEACGKAFYHNPVPGRWPDDIAFLAHRQALADLYREGANALNAVDPGHPSS